MGRGLFEFEEVDLDETAQETHSTPDGMDAYLQRRAALDQSKQLLESIESQLAQGTPPQYVLYTALRLIGLLTGASEWEARQRAALDHVYEDLAQESLFADNAAIAAQRLDDQRRDYVNKTRKQLMRSLRAMGKLETALKTALDAVGELDDPASIDEILQDVPQPK